MSLTFTQVKFLALLVLKVISLVVIKTVMQSCLLAAWMLDLLNRWQRTILIYIVIQVYCALFKWVKVERRWLPEFSI